MTDNDLAAWLKNGEMAELNHDLLNGRITRPRAVTVREVDARPKQSQLENNMQAYIDMLATQNRDYLANYKAEYRFHQTRRWRFDFAWPDMMVAVEVEGGQWSRGRHQRGKGFEDDCEKYNHATMLGWRVFRFTTDMVKDRRALAFLESVFPPF